MFICLLSLSKQKYTQSSSQQGLGLALYFYMIQNTSYSNNRFKRTEEGERMKRTERHKNIVGTSESRSTRHSEGITGIQFPARISFINRCEEENEDMWTDNPPSMNWQRERDRERETMCDSFYHHSRWTISSLSLTLFLSLSFSFLLISSSQMSGCIER